MEKLKPGLNRLEKIERDPAELAIAHINFELGRIEQELQHDARMGRLCKGVGVAGMALGATGIFLLLESWGSRGVSQELINAFRNFDFNSIRALSDGRLLTSSIMSLVSGVTAFSIGREAVRNAVQKAERGRNRILTEYLKK
jgi:hypothetical protein